jgi:hypothetical protein
LKYELLFAVTTLLPYLFSQNWAKQNKHLFYSAEHNACLHKRSRFPKIGQNKINTLFIPIGKSANRQNDFKDLRTFFSTPDWAKQNKRIFLHR